MDFKDIIKQLAPIAGSLIGGPLAGFAIKQIGDAIGMSSPTVERITAAIQTGSLTPDQVMAIRQADDALKVKLAEIGLDHEKLEAETERAYLVDTQQARTTHAGDQGVFWLGIVILATYAGVLGLTLAGAYWMLVGGNIKDMDAGLVAAVFSLVGAILGYIASDAKQVVSYYFGSSKGSNDKSRDMADAIKNLGVASAKTV